MITRQQLFQFCGNSAYRPWVNEPFISDSKVIATDTHFIISLPLDMVDCSDIKNINQKIPFYEKDFWKPFDRAAFSSFLGSLPTSEENIRKTNATTCPDCNGRGEVTFEYHSYHNHKIYEIEDVCPCCSGLGEIEEVEMIKTGRMIIPDTLTVGISDETTTGYYPYFVVNKVSDALALINPDSAYLTKHDGKTTVITARKKMQLDSDAPFIAFATMVSNKETKSELIFKLI